MKQHVLADPTVLEEFENGILHMTPLIHAIFEQKLAIAHWLIDHRGQHDVDTRGGLEMTALLWACFRGPLSIVQALVASGADPSATDAILFTPLIKASYSNHPDIVTYLLQLPGVRATVDAVNYHGLSALCFASSEGSSSCVQLLLDAGADPTIPAGDKSPLNCVIREGHTAIAALLRHTIAEPDRARTLHKARSLLDAAIIIRKTKQDARDDGDAQAVQQQKVIAVAPVHLKDRVQVNGPLPRVEFTPRRGDERLRATVAFVVGLEEGGVEYAGLPQKVYVDLRGYMLPAWANKGQEA